MQKWSGEMWRVGSFLVLVLTATSCSDTARPIDSGPAANDAGTGDVSQREDVHQPPDASEDGATLTCGDIDGSVQFDVAGTGICAFSGNVSEVCPASHPHDEEVGNVLTCADSSNADEVEVLDELERRCEAIRDQMNCDSATGLGCQWVPAEYHQESRNGVCEPTDEGVCVFAPEPVGQVSVCMGRKDSGTVEVVLVDGVQSPTWEDDQDVRDPACECVDP